jgi:hypothetical protein
MNKFIAVLKKDFKLMLNKNLSIIGILLLPIFFLGIMLYSYSDIFYKKIFIEPFPILIYDKEDSKNSLILVGQLRQLNLFNKIDITNDEKIADSFIEKDYAALIIIPENFVYNTSIGKNPPLNVIGNKQMPFRANLVKNLVQSTVNLVISGQSTLNTLYHFNKNIGFSQTELDSLFKDSMYKLFFQILGRKQIFEKTNSNIYGANTQMSIFYSTLALFIGFLGVPVVKILMEEKIAKLSLRLKCANIGIIVSFFSKYLLTAIIGFLQVLLLYFFAVKFFELNININKIAFLALFFTTIFSFSSLITFIVTICKNHFSSDLTSNLTLFLMALISGCFYPSYTLPEFARIAGKYTIHKLFIDEMVRISYNDYNLFTMTCLYLCGIGFIFYIVSFLIHKYKELA